MPTILQRLVDFCRGVRDDLGGLRNAIQDHAEAIRDSNPAEQTDQDRQTSVFTTTKLDSESSIETRKPKDEKEADSDYQFWSLVVQWCTVGVVALYTTVAAFQWCAIREANKIARDSFEVQTRPWIAVEDLSEPVISVLPGSSPPTLVLDFNYILHNLGKSPGLHIYGYFQFAKGRPEDALFKMPKTNEDVCDFVERTSVDSKWKIYPSIFPESKSDKIPYRPPSETPDAPIANNALAGCIVYQSPGHIHRTRVLYWFVREEQAVTIGGLKFFPIKGFTLEHVEAD